MNHPNLVYYLMDFPAFRNLNHFLSQALIRWEKPYTFRRGNALDAHIFHHSDLDLGDDVLTFSLHHISFLLGFYPILLYYLCVDLHQAFLL